MDTHLAKWTEEIPETIKKKKLFEKLIEIYPRNPHYYNHLARLLVEGSSNDYNPAIELLNKAIEILEEDERTLLKTGRVALSLTDSKTSRL
ncbi:tetratricopeptide repeat protein [[Clostridium] hylemonae]|uniref:Uncharacterized protein n=1 Tax=[Clostridium] hylemonae DSM 15053 TaxID=553973 RepID=C0C007_9FIRM|nr:hypothetical protein [[Clostridium] hylemonae]EEG74735.1 hypothetical protein CLOHYLEM_05399 [[Clostridium] hylemonae DSM 15053]